MSDFDRLTDFQNLYASMKVAWSGSRRNASAAHFICHGLENLIAMKHDLLSRTYKMSPYRSFVISDPKKRVIMAGSFRDKVMQHCLCDYILLPRLRDVFITDNYAGQIGKGTLYGLNRLSTHLMSYYENNGSNGYILKGDISKFYYSIRHDVMKQIVATHFTDDGICWLCNLIIDSTEGDGLPLGNQSSQVFAQMYLAGFDDLITKELQWSRYGRFSDDFFVIGDSRDALKNTLIKAREYLASIGLSLNCKTQIVPIRRGIRFLGFHTYLTCDGNIVRRLCGDKKRSEKKKIRRCANLVKQGRMSERKFFEIYNSIKNHLSHGDCSRLIAELDLMVEEILK